MKKAKRDELIVRTPRGKITAKVLSGLDYPGISLYYEGGGEPGVIMEYTPKKDIVQLCVYPRENPDEPTEILTMSPERESVDESVAKLIDTLLSALPDEPSCRGGKTWQDGESIFCPDEDTANHFEDIVLRLTQGRVSTTTGYYDPEEDMISGNTDRYTGYWYVDICM